MGRLAPEELWRRHTIKRFVAFKQSGELDRLRKKGLSICGRKKRYSPEEWFHSFSRRYSLPGYREFAMECAAVGERFGLASWTVYCACLVLQYEPAEQPFPIEIEWPVVRVVTKSTEPDFLTKLAYEAQMLGLYVVQRQGSVDNVHLLAHPVPLCQLEPPPVPSSLPPRESAFSIRVEVPIGYPPEAGARLQKEVSRLARELARSLGYPMPHRLRSSPLVSMASTLRVGEKLSFGEAYDIVDDVYGGDLTDDEKRRRLIGSRRHRLKKRLIEPHQTDTNASR